MAKADWKSGDLITSNEMNKLGSEINFSTSKVKKIKEIISTDKSVIVKENDDKYDLHVANNYLKFKEPVFNQDWNDIEKSGIYPVYEPKGENRPLGSDYGYVEVIEGYGLKQTYHNLNGRTAVRFKVGNPPKWVPWRYFSHKRVISSDNSVIIKENNDNYDLHVETKKAKEITMMNLFKNETGDITSGKITFSDGSTLNITVS